MGWRACTRLEQWTILGPGSVVDLLALDGNIRASDALCRGGGVGVQLRRLLMQPSEHPFATLAVLVCAFARVPFTLKRIVAPLHRPSLYLFGHEERIVP